MRADAPLARAEPPARQALPAAAQGMRASILPLRVERLGFAVDGRDLLADVSFEIAPGSTTALLGPNGAGKSLLLRLCHGLLTPTAGALRWAGDPAPGGRRRHAMVFQKPVMLRRSVLANFTHALAAAGVGRAARRPAALEALARFALDRHAQQPARLMSGGEQQRFAIARARALDPEVLFLDEPTAHLDPGATRQIEQMLRELQAEGRTLLLATHDLGQARRLADRVLFLDRGRLREDAATGAFFADPKNPQASAFLRGELAW